MSKLGKEIASGHLPMFMTPDEISEHHHLGDTDYLGDRNKPLEKKSPEQQDLDKSLFDRKQVESMLPRSYGNTSLYDSIKEHGIQKPINIGYSPSIPFGIVTDGHHRLAVSRHLNPKQFVPVKYDNVTNLKLFL